MIQPRKSVLGRGLDALLDSNPVMTSGTSSINEIELSMIFPNPDQPRREFDQEALEELSASIKQLGVIQPITLRKLEDETYQIIAGERRFRASKMAGLNNIPAYIKTNDEKNLMEMALVENIQREDLNAIEIALAYQTLIEQHQLTQEMLSERVGKKRTTVANYLRLLKLPAEIQLGLTNKCIDMGHARALLAVEDPALQLDIYEMAVKEGLSVRKVEEMVKATNKETQAELPKEEETNPLRRSNEEYNMLADHLSGFFECKVKLKCSDKGKGSLNIAFQTEEELERILSILELLQ